MLTKKEWLRAFVFVRISLCCFRRPLWYCVLRQKAAHFKPSEVMQVLWLIQDISMVQRKFCEIHLKGSIFRWIERV